MTSEQFYSNFEDIDPEIKGVRLPSFEIEPQFKRELKVSEDINNLDFLRALSLKGFESLKLKKGTKKYKEYSDRARKELETLDDLGFIDYTLLVWDVVNFCKVNDIPTGLGRGSAAGSLILYLIGVTKIDPVRYGLFFERFVSKIRAKKHVVDGVTYLDGSLMCDVDLDICFYNRQKVLEYLSTKFRDRTSKIITLNTLSGKLCIKEAGKVVSDKSETEMNKVSAMIPKVFGKVKDLEETYEEVKEFREWCDENPKVYKIALKTRNLIKNKGVHPSAVLLSHDLINETCPLELTSDKESQASSYDMNWVSLFNVKLDILGLRSVSVVDDCCKQIGIEIGDIDVTDKKIYENLQNLTTPHGLFQIEADTNFKVCKKVKPKDLEELSAVLALARPGALAFVDQYAEYVNEQEFNSLDPFFDDILSPTGGVALYQEQLMKMANKVGFTLDEAEILRRIVGKKKVAEVRKWKKKIEKKVKENGLSKKVAEILWQLLEDSANYSFNKSHSIAYAALAAATIYLKFNYPKEFFLSLLKMTRYEPDPINEISKIHKEMNLFGIELLRPHLLKSKMGFSIEGNSIRFGLLSIKGISDKSMEKLNNFKDEYSNKFQVFEAAKEAGLTVGVLSALIQAGAFEGFKQSRTKVVYEAQLWNILTKREKKHVMLISDKNDFDLVEIVRGPLLKMKDDKNKEVVKPSRFETIKRKCEPYKKIYEINSKSENFANWFYENNLLGYTHGLSLKSIFAEQRKYRSLMDMVEMEEVPSGSFVSFIGKVEGKPHASVSKNGNRYFKMDAGDETGTIRVMIFKEKMEKCREMNNGFPKEKDVVIVKGTKNDDVIFANEITVPKNKIYSKLSDIEKDIA